MGIARITSGPSKNKQDAYLNHDINRKSKKQIFLLKIVGTICVVSVLFNIYLILK